MSSILHRHTPHLDSRIAVNVWWIAGSLAMAQITIVGAIHGISGFLSEIISCPKSAWSPKRCDLIMDPLVFMQSY
jgi:hypothetical protein